MSSGEQQGIQFPQLLALSLGLLLISIFLTYGHTYSWTGVGIIGWWSVPVGIALALLVFIGPVYLLSHRLLRINAFYRLTDELHGMCHHFTWPQIIVLSVLAGLSEELLFRGALQSWLTESIGIYTAIVISSLVFALLHAMSWYYFAFAFLMSVFLGLTFFITQSMVLVVVVHAVYDIIALGVIAKSPQILGVSNKARQGMRF